MGRIAFYGFSASNVSYRIQCLHEAALAASCSGGKPCNRETPVGVEAKLDVKWQILTKRMCNFRMATVTMLAMEILCTEF